MRFFKRATVAILTLSLGLVAAACSSDNPAGPEASGSAAKPAMSGGDPGKRPDPVVQKTYRSEACYYGALALKTGRDAYLASLGGAEPSADKIPQFGGETEEAKGEPPAPVPPPATSGSAAAPSPASSAAPKPAASAKAAAPPATSAKAHASAKASAAASAPASSAAPEASASAKTNPMVNEKLKQIVRYDQFVRHCNSALTIKEAANDDLDKALRDFSDFALPMARVLQEANTYYSQGKYKDDAFAQGKTYHACLTSTGTCEVKEKAGKTLTNAFATLDEKLSAFKAAVDKYKTANPVDKSGYEESQKAADKAVDDATALLMVLDAKPPVDMEKLKAAVAKLETSTAALKAFGEGKETPDQWARNVAPQLDLLVKEAKALSEKTAADITPGKVYKIINMHNRVLEKNYAALQGKLRGTPGGGRIPPQRKNMPKMNPAPKKQ